MKWRCGTPRCTAPGMRILCCAHCYCGGEGRCAAADALRRGMLHRRGVLHWGVLRCAGVLTWYRCGGVMHGPNSQGVFSMRHATSTSFPQGCRCASSARAARLAVSARSICGSDSSTPTLASIGGPVPAAVQAGRQALGARSILLHWSTATAVCPGPNQFRNWSDDWRDGRCSFAWLAWCQCGARAGACGGRATHSRQGAGHGGDVRVGGGGGGAA